MDANPNGTPTGSAAIVDNAPSQTTRKVVLGVTIAAAIAILVVGHSRLPDTGWIHEGIEGVGLGLIVLCILGRTWCTIYIGGRKNQALVTEGPYSISRNPLYFFSIIGAAGVGAQMGSLLAALVCGFVAWAIFLWTVRREEAALSAAFADSYPRYVARVPRFLPDFSLWQAPETVVVRPQIIQTTFFDALIFLVAVPLAEGLEYLQDIGLVPVYLTLP